MDSNFFVLKSFVIFALTLHLTAGNPTAGKIEKVNWTRELNDTLELVNEAKIKLDTIFDELYLLEDHNSTLIPDFLKFIDSHKDVAVLKASLYKFGPDLWNLPKRLLCRQFFDNKAHGIDHTVKNVVYDDLKPRIELVDAELTQFRDEFHLAGHLLHYFGEKYVKECEADIKNCPIMEVKQVIQKRHRFMDMTLSAVKEFGEKFLKPTDLLIRRSLIPKVKECLGEE